MKRKTRKKLNRSGKAKCDICHEVHILVTHHLEGRDILNANHLSNLAHICDSDHRLVHEGIIIIEKWVQTSNGLELLWHFADQESITGEEAKPYIIGDKYVIIQPVQEVQ